MHIPIWFLFFVALLRCIHQSCSCLTFADALLATFPLFTPGCVVPPYPGLFIRQLTETLAGYCPNNTFSVCQFRTRQHFKPSHFLSFSKSLPHLIAARIPFKNSLWLNPSSEKPRRTITKLREGRIKIRCPR